MLRLAYGSLVIALDSPEAAPLAWLREFLGAAFEAPPSAVRPDRTLRLEFGQAPPAPAPSDEVEVFSLDGSFLRLPAVHAPDGSLVIRDEPHGIVCALRGPDVTILAPADGPALRLALLRITREIATAHALREGHLHLHASAIEIGGEVLAMAGPRESGKTTLLLHSLLSGKARYVTNDRLLVDVRAAPPLARGMATIVSLRAETLARFPDFARRLHESGYARERTLAEAAALNAPSRPNLTPAQLRALAGAEEVGSGPLRALIFPALAPGIERFEVRALPADEAAACLRKGLFLATLPERPAVAFSGGTPPRDARTLDRLCRDLAARVPCFGVRLGPRAYDGKTVADTVRERLP